MTIASDYLLIIDSIADTIALPPIREIYIAPYSDNEEKIQRFGALVLEDDTVGLTYIDLDDAMRILPSRPERHQLVGCSPVEAARLYAGAAGWQRCLGMAAVNAISQHLLKRSAYALTESAGTTDLLAIEPGDHIGMVGYFPPLVDQIRGQDVSLTVIELDEKWLGMGQGVEVTLNADRLSACNKILCTGTVLVNHTLDTLLAYTQDADALFLIGPSVGCLPDPLFERGVTAVGGRQVVDHDHFVELWQTRLPWRQATRRYTIAAGQYPGFEALLHTL